MTVTENIGYAHDVAAARLRNAHGSIREAFDLLETGVTFDDLWAYIERDFHAKAVYGAADLDAAHARIVGLVAGACLTVVESDRKRWAEKIETPSPAGETAD